MVSKKIGSEEPYSSYFQDIMSDVRRLEKIVKSVQEYTNVPVVSPVAIEVSELIAEVCEQGNSIAIELSRSITWDVHCDPFQIAVDPKSFMAALLEIVKNSIEFLGRPEGVVGIKAVQESGGRTIIDISDNGSGISDKDMPYIFDPFYTTKAVGVGMGLCKAHRIIADHDGKIHIESRLSMGTIVSLELPNSRPSH